MYALSRFIGVLKAVVNVGVLFGYRELDLKVYALLIRGYHGYRLERGTDVTGFECLGLYTEADGPLYIVGAARNDVEGGGVGDLSALGDTCDDAALRYQVIGLYGLAFSGVERRKQGVPIEGLSVSGLFDLDEGKVDRNLDCNSRCGLPGLLIEGLE